MDLRSEKVRVEFPVKIEEGVETWGERIFTDMEND